MPRRQADKATTAILEHARNLERRSTRLNELVTFGPMYLFFFLADACTLSVLSRSLIVICKIARNSTQWQSLLIVANSSVSKKVRGKAFFYLGSAVCESLDRDTLRWLQRDPLPWLQTAFFFFTKALKCDPDDCWARKCRAEPYNGFGEDNLHLGSLYTAQDALSDAREALDFFRSLKETPVSLEDMISQCEQLVADLTHTVNEKAKP